MKNHLRTIVILLVFVAASFVGVRGAPEAKASPQGWCYLNTFAAGQYFTGSLGRSSRTSCPFAKNVFKVSVGKIVRAGGEIDGNFRIFAWSPVTQRWYHARCFAYGDIYSNYRTHVDCRAGIGARVVFTARIH